MATPNELIAMVAKLEGLPEPAVARVAGRLREAGLISQSGRGPSAARATAADAANLLIAVNAAPVPEDAPKIVAWHRGMLNYRHAPAPEQIGGSAVERAFLRDIAFIVEGRATFGEVFERLLAMAANGALRRSLHNIGLVYIAAKRFIGPAGSHARKEADRRERVRAVLAGGGRGALDGLRRQLRGDLDELIRLSAASVLVRFGRPFPTARIEVRRGDRTASGPPEGGTRLIDVGFEVDFDTDLIQAESDHLHDVRSIARTEVVTIDQRALLAVGELLADGVQEPIPATAWAYGT
jgi:hypothetical protein